jgi:hypothetical protein
LHIPHFKDDKNAAQINQPNEYGFAPSCKSQTPNNIEMY